MSGARGAPPARSAREAHGTRVAADAADGTAAAGTAAAASTSTSAAARPLPATAFHTLILQTWRAHDAPPPAAPGGKPQPHAHAGWLQLRGLLAPAPAAGGAKRALAAADELDARSPSPAALAVMAAM